MDASEKDKTPMLPATIIKSDDQNISATRDFSNRMRSENRSLSIPLDSHEQQISHVDPLRNGRRSPIVQRSGPLYITPNNEAIFQPPQLSTFERKTTDHKVEKLTSFDWVDNSNNNDWDLVNYEGKNENLLKSGPLGMCNDPYCTTCPTYFDVKGRRKLSRTSEIFDAKLHNMLYGDAKGYAKRLYSFLEHYIPRVMNPHAKAVQQWNQFFVISCLFAVFLDPLFFFLLNVQESHKCIALNWPMTTTIVVLRSMTDFIYFLHILLQAGLCCS